MFAINDGPFAGHSFTFQEAIQSLVGPEQIEKAAIVMSALNRAFLQHYKPVDGWAVVVDGQMVGIDMAPLPSESESAAPVPCARFDAKLISPDGRTMATASSLWTICGPTSWERGETNARLRLYEASGLQTRFEKPRDVVLSMQPGSKGLEPSRQSSAASAASERTGGTILQFRPYVEEQEVDTSGKADRAPAVVDSVEPALDTTASHSEPVTTGAGNEEAQMAQAQVACSGGATIDQVAAASSTSAKQGGGPTKGRRGQPKKRELDRDAPISPELADRCRTMAKMRFKKVPEMSNTGEALDFLADIG